MGHRVEQPPAAIGEIDAVLEVGDIEPVRHEEVRAQQHVGFQRPQIGDVEPHIVQFLIADLQQLEPRGPTLDDMAAEATLPSRHLDARIAGMDARPGGGVQRQDGLRRPGVESRVQFAPSSSTVPTVWLCA